jgi:hypothetical protein
MSLLGKHRGRVNPEIDGGCTMASAFRGKVRGMALQAGWPKQQQPDAYRVAAA